MTSNVVSLDLRNEPLTVELRIATAEDGWAMRRLAALDDAPMLEGRVLIALEDGVAVAAISLADGRVIADPFVLTEHAVAMLRLRAGHLARRRGRGLRLPVLRPRVA